MVKPGYKQTEIGIIPENWDAVPFDSCFQVLKNNTLSRAELNDDAGILRNIHYGDVLIRFGCVLNADSVKIPFVTEPRKNVPLSVLKDGDLVIADTAEDETVGKAVEIKGAAGKKIVSGLHTIPCRPQDPDMFANGWLGYFINHTVFHDQLLPLITGTKVSAISKSALSNTIVAVPRYKKEQERIVEALTDADNLISSLEKLIEKKKAIKQGAMQQLLTGKIRLHGFTQAWGDTTLGKLASDIKTGTRNNEEKNEFGKYPFFVRSQQVEKIDKYSYDCEAILVPGEGNIGNIYHYTNGKFDCHQRVYKISGFKNADAKFVYYYMQLFFGQYALSNTVKATVDSLRLPVFKSFMMIVPLQINEQKQISQVLTDIDDEIEALNRKLNKARCVKQGMMQQLLTGRIRITERGNK